MGKWYSRHMAVSSDSGQTLTDRQGAIRFMIFALYSIFMLPGLFAARRFAERSGTYQFNLVLGVIVLFLFFATELVEFRVFHYRYRSRGAVTALFALRVVFLAVHWVLFRTDHVDPLHHNPVLSAYLPLLAFYAYFAFPRRLSVLIAAGMVIVPGVEGLFRIVPTDPTHGPDALGFLLFRAVVGAFFYAFAWLWDTERMQNDDNRKLLKELHHSERQLREYADKVGRTVALEERTRLARDVHDTIGHALTAITIQLNKAKAYFSVDLGEVESAVSAALETANDAMGDVRESLVRLNDDTAGVAIETSIPRLVRQLEATGHTVDLSVEGDESTYNYAVIIGVYRCLQESITNIIKHAEATHVTIRVELGDEEGLITIIDDGRGFEKTVVENAADRNEHFGLRGLRRRFELVGGYLEITSSPGNGTTLHVRVPRDPLAPIEDRDA